MAPVAVAGARVFNSTASPLQGGIKIKSVEKRTPVYIMFPARNAYICSSHGNEVYLILLWLHVAFNG